MELLELIRDRAAFLTLPLVIIIMCVFLIYATLKKKSLLPKGFKVMIIIVSVVIISLSAAAILLIILFGNNA